MKHHLQSILGSTILLVTMQVSAQVQLALKPLLEKKEFITAEQAKDSCQTHAWSLGDGYNKLYCEPTVWISKVRYSWTEIRNKKELAKVLVNTKSSKSSSSNSSSGSDSASIFGAIASWASRFARSSSSSGSSYERSETPVYEESPVAVRMYQDRDQVRYGYILYGVPQELNLDAPEVYDSETHYMKFSTYAEALSTCGQNLAAVHGFQHVGKCQVYMDEQGMFGFQMEAKMKFK